MQEKILKGGGLGGKGGERRITQKTRLARKRVEEEKGNACTVTKKGGKGGFLSPTPPPKGGVGHEEGRKFEKGGAGHEEGQKLGKGGLAMRRAKN